MAALAALDALPVSHVGHVHLARAGTQAAAVALARIHPEGQQSHPAEEGVDSPQRAQEAAEGPVAEYTQQQNRDAQTCLPGEEPPGQGAILLPQGHQGNTTLQGTGGTDIFAEAGQGIAGGKCVPQGDGNDKHRQHSVLQPRQPAAPLSFFDLFSGDLVEQLLNKPKGAKEAADQPPQTEAQQH